MHMRMQSLSFPFHQLVESIGPIPNQSNEKGGSPTSLGCFGFGLLKKTSLEDVFQTFSWPGSDTLGVWNKLIDSNLGFNFCQSFTEWLSGYHLNHLRTHPGRSTYMDTHRHVEHEDLCRKIRICFSDSIS